MCRYLSRFGHGLIQGFVVVVIELLLSVAAVLLGEPFFELRCVPGPFVDQLECFRELYFAFLLLRVVHL